jgi:hypothetical protein
LATPAAKKQRRQKSHIVHYNKVRRPHRHNVWAHFRQRLRRNCFSGPALVLFLAVLVVPCLLDIPVAPTQELIAPYLPLVEAVPFFRRITNKNRVTRTDTTGTTTSTANNHSALGGRTQATNTERPAPSRKSNRRRKAAKQYYFPLFDDHESLEQDPQAPVPFRYLEAHQKEAPARKAVMNSLEWRKQWDIDNILSKPHPNYDIAKRILPHYFIGTSEKTKHVVFIQRPGLADLKLAKHNGVSLDDMLYQYAWVFEYCW